MNLFDAIDTYIADMRVAGRINSDATERGYRQALELHARDVSNRDPRTTNRDDCKRTLARWKHPNTQRGRRAVLVSFYDWAMEEGIRKDNPARQTRRPRRRPATVYRLTRTEAASMLAAAQGQLERRAIYLGICAGLRSGELRGLRGRHFRRDGWIEITADIAKGKRPRWVPVITELELVVAEIRAHAADDDYVLPGTRRLNLSPGRPLVEHTDRPMSSQTLWRMVGRVGRRAGVPAEIHPHLLRHAFGDHVARNTGLKVAQTLLGHADVATTQLYVGQPTLDELARAVTGLGFSYPPTKGTATPLVETVGIEPTQTSHDGVERGPPAQGDPDAANAADREPPHP